MLGAEQYIESDPRLEDRLLTVWDLSSKQQGHFSISRAAALIIGRAELDDIADDVLTIWDQFAHNFTLYRTAEGPPRSLANRVCNWLRRR
jgi:hypothetical protein